MKSFCNNYLRFVFVFVFAFLINNKIKYFTLSKAWKASMTSGALKSSATRLPMYATHASCVIVPPVPIPTLSTNTMIAIVVCYGDDKI